LTQIDETTACDILWRENNPELFNLTPRMEPPFILAISARVVSPDASFSSSLSRAAAFSAARALNENVGSLGLMTAS
jgi:hypothetical protein